MDVGSGGSGFLGHSDTPGEPAKSFLEPLLQVCPCPGNGSIFLWMLAHTFMISKSVLSAMKHLSDQSFFLKNQIPLLKSPMDQQVNQQLTHAGDAGVIPGLERSLGEGNGNPRQYSFLENPMDRGAWQDAVHGVAKTWTQLSAQAATETHSGVFRILNGPGLLLMP